MGETVEEVLASHPELTRTDPPFEGNVSAQHPAGFHVTFKVVCKPQAVVANLNLLIEKLVAGGFTPQAPVSTARGAVSGRNGTGLATTRQQPSVQRASRTAVVCLDCGGPCYDNRAAKQAGKRSANSPHYRCKDRDGCGAAGWQGKDGVRWVDGDNNPLEEE